MKTLSDINIHLENKKESRIFFAFIWLIYTTVYMTKNCFSGALAAIVDEGVFSLTQTTLITASFYLVYTPMQIVGGFFADKYNPERLITLGLVGAALANAVIFFNQNYYLMLFMWIFNAAIQFGIWPAVFKILSSQLVRSDRSQMIFLMSLGTPAGLLLSYSVSAFLTDWRYNFLISAVILIVDVALLHNLCHRLNPILKKDHPPVIATDEKNGRIGSEKSAFKIFLTSGFFVFLVPVVLKTIVENGSKTLSPTILMQSYAEVSPMLGNLLNILIIISGICGSLLVKLVLYPKVIKNEVAGFFIMLLLSLPFVFVLGFIGNIPVWLAVVSLCLVSMLLTATNLFIQYYSTNFISCGKNGTASGIINSAASLGILLQFCLLGPLADSFGWNVVMGVWIALTLLSAVVIVFAIRPISKFKRMQ